MNDASFLRMQRALPLPYRAVDATPVIAAAQARAARSGKRLLLDFGANWCSGCRLFAGVMGLPELRGFVAQHYEVVLIDIGRMDRNPGAARRFGLSRIDATPTVLIVDPVSGHRLNAGHEYPLLEAETVQDAADWLARYA